MRWRVAFIAMTMAVCPGQMCTQTIAPPTCLATADVLNIPPGNARGSFFSGDYMIISGYMESCKECSQNTCANPCGDFQPTLQEGGVVRVSQNNGAITFHSENDTVTGGINADGTFRIGTIIPTKDNAGETNGQTLALFEGTFTSDRILANVTFHMTANTPDLCDLQNINVVTYQRVSGASPNDLVAIEFANNTDYPIEPRLFIDPTAHITVEGLLIRDDNWVLVDPPLQAGEVATYEFRCEDIGTMATDHAQMYISDEEYIESDNGPWLVAGDDFVCGDTIGLMFVDDGTVFFTRVEVNGQFLTD